MNYRFLIAPLQFFLVACVTPTPELTKRYNTILYDPSDQAVVAPGASISLFSLATPSPDEKPKSVVDLADRGQSEFVTFIGTKTEDANEFAGAVFKQIQVSRPKDIDRSRVVLNRRLVFSLQSENFHPADRLEEAVASLQLAQIIRFVSWNQFENRYKTIKPGTLELEKKNTTTIEGSISVPQIKELGEISLKQEQARGLKETASLERDIVQFWARLHDNQATIFQKGASSIDLTGTFTIDAVLAFKDGQYDQMDAVKFDKLFDKEGKAQSVEKIVTSSARVQFPRQACDVKGALGLKYQIRKVQSGGETLTESDDTIVMMARSAKAVPDILVVPGRELEFNVWDISAPVSDDNQIKWEKIAGPGKEAVSFGTFDDALNFCGG